MDTDLPELDRDRIFVALTRPQTFAGVSYGVVVANAVVTTELFLMFKVFSVIFAALILHVAAWAACLREPRFFEIWQTRMSKCPRIPNWRFWNCNSYRP
ncbi:MAG: VirB3 family type IV secretion system protein [Sphingomonadales bacterium]|nr:VirB3 family type IV secretion system protein [Sphingomonadales bacterium]